MANTGYNVLPLSHGRVPRRPLSETALETTRRIAAVNLGIPEDWRTWQTQAPGPPGPAPINWHHDFATVGLKRDGNTCYFLSLIQCVIHHPRMAQWFRYLHPASTCQEPNCAACAARDLLQQYWSGINPSPNRIQLNAMKRNLLRCFQNAPPSQMPNLTPWLSNISLHQDALELYTHFINRLTKTNLPAQTLDALGRLVKLNIQTSIKCPRCNHSSVQNSEDFSLTIPIPIPSIDDNTPKSHLLNKLITEEFTPITINGWICSEAGCASNGQPQDPLQRKRIEAAPDMLCLHLPRTSFRGGVLWKNCAEIKFRENLNLSRWLLRSSGDRPALSYQLYAVVRHIGSTTDRGHYVAFGQAMDSKWSLINDNDVQQTSHNGSYKDAKYHNSPTTMPYLLFFKRNYF